MQTSVITIAGDVPGVEYRLPVLSFEGRDPQNPTLFEKKWNPAKFYHDVRLGIDVGPKYNFYMGVDNLTDTKPPFGASGLGGNTGLYDVIGRFMYAGVSAKF